MSSFGTAADAADADTMRLARNDETPPPDAEPFCGDSGACGCTCFSADGGIGAEVGRGVVIDAVEDVAAVEAAPVAAVANGSAKRTELDGGADGVCATPLATAGDGARGVKAPLAATLALVVVVAVVVAAATAGLAGTDDEPLVAPCVAACVAACDVPGA